MAAAPSLYELAGKQHVILTPPGENGFLLALDRARGLAPGAAAAVDALELDWRLHDLVVMPVRELPRGERTPDTGREGRTGARRGAEPAPPTHH